MHFMALCGGGDKEFYVRSANSRGALTPSNVHRTFLVRLHRFTVISRWQPTLI